MFIMDIVFNVPEMFLSSFSMGAMQSSWNEVRCIHPHPFQIFLKRFIELLLFTPGMSDRFPMENSSLYEKVYVVKSIGIKSFLLLSYPLNTCQIYLVMSSFSFLILVVLYFISFLSEWLYVNTVDWSLITRWFH